MAAGSPAESFKREGPSPGPDAGEAFDAKSLIRSTIASLSTAGTRGYMTDETIDYLREICPGWDLQTLHGDFERWINASDGRTPADWQRAFIGWVKRHDEKHRHELRR